MVAGKHHTAEFLYRIGGRFPISDDLEAVSGGIGLVTSGARMWVRVRAIGADPQPGPYSDPAAKTVP